MPSDYPPEVIRVVGKEYSPEILQAATEPKSAKEISDELGIPIATCYRRLETLEQHGLLIVEEIPQDERPDVKRYHRPMQRLSFDFSDSLAVTDEEKDGLKSKLRHAFDKLRTS